MGIVKLSLNDLEAETEKEIVLRLLPSLDTLKVKDKKDRGSLTIKVWINQYLFIYCEGKYVLYLTLIVTLLYAYINLRPSTVHR